jgi:hypothetical protein
MFKILVNFYFINKNKTNLSSLAMNEEDLVASFKSIGRFKSSDLASLSTIDDPAHKLIKHSEEQEPGEIVNKNEILNETLNVTITNSNSDEVILENNEIIKIDQDGSSATSTPYIKQQLPSTLNKVDRLIQEAMNKYSSPNTSVVTATSSTPSINFKNLTKSTLTPGIKLKIKDNSIVEDSSNKQENETSNKPIESFNLVIKKNPDSSSSVILKQAAAAAAAANQATTTTTTTPIQNLNKNQQFIPKLKISNSANRQIPDSGHNSAVLNFFNNEILKKDNKIDKQSIQALKIKPIIIGSGDEMNDKGNSKDSSFSDKQYQKNRFDEIDQADLVMTSSSMKLNFDDDENAMDGVESKKYFSSSSSTSNNNKPNEPLIWKPVFNDSPQSTNNNNNNEKQKTALAPPPPIAPFTIKPKQFNVDLNAKKIAKNNENKISIVDYSSNSNESNSNSHQSNNKKLVETETISSSSRNKVNSKDDQSTEKNENTGEISTKEKHKKKKKNKDKDKDKKHHHHHHGEKKDKSNTDELHHASSPSSTASSTKKKDKKEKKELKKQQKKLEKAGMINSETSIDEKNMSKTNEEISNDQQLKMNKGNQIKKVFILSIFKSLLYLTKYLHFELLTVQIFIQEKAYNP